MKKHLKYKNFNILLFLIISIIILLITNKIIRPYSKAEENVNKSNVLSSTNVNFSGGSGTEEDPYVIETAEDLQSLAKKVNSHEVDGNGNYYKTKYYILNNDISFKDKEWIPIGMKDSYNLEDCTTNYSFQGNFNGNGHKISDITYEISEVPSKRGTYGVFGMLWGDSNGYASVYNLIIDNMNITLSASGTTDRGISIGTIAGHLGIDSSIRNCIVRNSSVTVNPSFYVKSEKQLTIGGIVGDASVNASSNSSGWGELTPTEYYGVENCFANVDIISNDEKWNKDSTGKYYDRYAIGGIIGTFCNVKTFPKNCIYEGTIQTVNAFAGTLFGNGEMTSLTRDSYLQLFAGVNSSNEYADTNEDTNYYYKTKFINKALTQQKYEIDETYIAERKTEIAENTGIYVYPLTDKTNTNFSMGYVQGVNRGTLTNNLQNQLGILNEYASANNKYNEWTYDGYEFSISTKSRKTNFSGGTGTANDPYILENASDLKLLATKVNSYSEDPNGGYFKSKYYKLNQNISLSGEEWIPIGFKDTRELTDCTTKYSFQGNFNGNGYTISDITYDLSTAPNKKGTYGLFGMLWGDGINCASIYNLLLDNVNFTISINGTTQNEITIGAITGHLGKDASIRNCIVNNSSITVNSTFRTSKEIKLSLGGIAGESSQNASYDSSAWSNFTITDNYGLENCFANVDIISNDEGWSRDSTEKYYNRYCIGGIVGSFCNVNLFPKSCIYEGTIQTVNAFAGPIFGRGEFISLIRDNYTKIFASIGSKDTSEDTNYYYNTKFVNKALNQQEYVIDSSYLKDRAIEADTNVYVYPLTDKDNSNSSMGYVQGVNRGSLLEDLSTAVETLNSYAGIGDKYYRWTYDSNSKSLVFGEKPIINIVRNNYNFSVNISNTKLDTNTFKYKWYIDDVEQTTETSKNIEINQSLQTKRVLKVEVYSENNELIGIKTLVIAKEKIDINLEPKRENDRNIAYVNISASNGDTKEDFRYEWYYKNENSTEYTIIKNATNYKYDYTDYDGGTDFKVIIKSNTFNEFSKEIVFSNSNVIYLKQNGGVDSNDGLTVDTAVQTLQQAYKLLPSYNNAKSNIIVIIGDYDAYFPQIYKKSESTVFNKNATICGKYLENDYSGRLRLMNNNYLNANTIIKDIELMSYSDTFINVQGNDLTMEESITFDGSLNMNAGTAGAWAINDITNYDTLKRITIVGGTKNYIKEDFGDVPDRVSNIVVKCSGIAVITGGARTQENQDADVYGTIDNHANVKITIDIPKASSTLDVGVVVGGQCDSSCYINSEINIENGKIGRIVGGTLGYGNKYNKNIPRDTFYGMTTVNINGGTIREIYGGSLGKNAPTSYMYGKVNLNITGGTIEDNIYGAGAGGTLGYHENSKDSFVKKDAEDTTYGVIGKTMTYIDNFGNNDEIELDKSEVNINISGGTIKGNVYGGGYGASAYLNSTQIADDGGTVYGNINLAITGGIIEGDVYGGGRGTSKYGTSKPELAQVYGQINVYILDNANIKGNVYGGSEGIDKYPNMSKIIGNIILNIKGTGVKVSGGSIYGCGNVGAVDGKVMLNISNVDLKSTVYGGGDGSTAIVENTQESFGNDLIPDSLNRLINISIKNSVIDGTVFGGGNAGNVYGNTSITVTNGTNITEAIYGGGNQANIGSEDKESNTYVYVSNANIGKISNTSITGGEVFGGGNLGVVYGKTDIEIGSTDDKITTNVGNQIYAGGKGEANKTTVKGTSTGKIIGINTSVNQYGSSNLGIVDGDVDIYFINYKIKNNTNKYKYMSGINKATNIYLDDSYVYLTEGLVNIVNLLIPNGTGMMISKDSEIEGNFTGGGELYLQSNVKLTIKGDLTKESEPTTLTINPKYNSSKSCYEIAGGEEKPYIIVLGTDYFTQKNEGGMNSGNIKKYEIRNNPEYSISETEVVSIYYIDENINISGYATENIYNIEGKVFNSPIANTNDVYILDNGAISSEVSVNYTMLKEFNENGELNFINDTEMKNLRRYIYMTGQNQATKLPVGTIITMIVNNEYYTYKIPENYGTEEFWETISNDQKYLNLKITENLGNEIPLCLFINSKGENFREVYDVQTLMKDEVAVLCSTSENYRFIIDFSDCYSLTDEEKDELYGKHEMIFDIWDYKTDSKNHIIQEETFTDRKNSNEIQIDERNYKMELDDTDALITQNDKINLDIQFDANDISILNFSDTGQSVKLKISLENTDNKIVAFPNGTVLKINEEDCTVINSEIIYTLIDSLNQNAYKKEINLQIDMSNVSMEDILASGNYKLKFEVYLANENILLGNNPIIFKTKNITFEKEDGYGMRVTCPDKLIFNKERTNKSVKIEVETGTANDAYIKIKTLKKVNGFEYKELAESFATESQITNLTDNQILSNITFDEFVNDGTYRIVYQLLDKNNNVLTEDAINFIVKRN